MILRVLINDTMSKSSYPREFETRLSCCIIGRQDSDLLLEDPRCSRQHALLFESEKGHLRVRDLRSTNGTYLHGKRIDEVSLSAGDVLRIGKATLKILSFTSALVAPKEPRSTTPQPSETESANIEKTLTQTGVVLHGSESLFKALPPEKRNEFVVFVDEEGTLARLSLEELLKKNNIQS